MHNQLISLLPKAIGASQQVIVVVADIRDFSKFSDATDAVYVATYIKNVYIKIIKLFSDVDKNIYYKATGDGLLMVIPFDEDNLSEKYNLAVNTCIECHSSFKSMMDNVAIINFPIPDKIGFGLSRGSACALQSTDDKSGKTYTLDYSGHKLNLASRLQDLARPSGVVLEGSKDIELLEDKLKKNFKEAEVFIKSIAESTSIKIWTNKTVEISPLNLRSLAGRWETYEFKVTKSRFYKLPQQYSLFLEEGVIIEQTVTVKIIRPPNTKIESAQNVYINLISGKDFWIYYEADKPKICLSIENIIKSSSKFLSIASTRKYLTFTVNYQVI